MTGQIRSVDDVKGDSRSFFPRFHPDNFQKNFEVVEKLEKIAEKKGVKSGQLGLAWLMTQGHGTGILPLFGTRSVARVKENLEGLNVTLTDKEIKEIRDVVDKAGAGGDYGARVSLSKLGWSGHECFETSPTHNGWRPFPTNTGACSDEALVSRWDGASAAERDSGIEGMNV